MSEYISSENLQRAAANKAEVFADNTKEKKVDTSESDRVKKVLDKYVKLHSNTVSVRAMAKENDHTADYQLDLSADIVEILTKIKNELR